MICATASVSRQDVGDFNDPSRNYSRCPLGRVPRGQAPFSPVGNPAEWRVWDLSTSGSRRADIPCRVEDGTLCFAADTARDPDEATFLYEIIRQ